MDSDKDLQTIRARFEADVRKSFGEKPLPQQKIQSQDYQQFRNTLRPLHQNIYEKACNFSEKIFAIKPDKKKEQELDEYIQTAHLNITPAGTVSCAIFIPLIFIMITASTAFVLSDDLVLTLFFVLLGASMIIVLQKLPEYYAEKWRMKSSNQMILSVFYIVTYMRHTSNFERAIEFASQHLQPPMSLEFKKILWDVETAKFSSINDSMENYLKRWRGYNDEFIESMHLIQGSLSEDSEQRRLESLDRSLDMILERTYEKMLHYAHNLQSPITTLHMLGIILPILGLVILPMVVSMMENARWYYIAMIYNIALPALVFVMGNSILSKRPTGYGAADPLDVEQLMKSKKSYKVLAWSIAIILLILGTSPIWLYWMGMSDFGIGADIDPAISVCEKTFCFLGYQTISNPDSFAYGQQRGPYGLGATLIGLLIPLAGALSIGLYYRLRTRGALETRKRTKKLENEFTYALFALGNRLEDGIPAEAAFARVAHTLPDSDSGRFCSIVNDNIQKVGMSLEQSIFHPEYGAIKNYPSALIESSMKVLIQSVKKGPKVASRALLNVSRYLDEVHKVNERLSDLMGEVISSMRSQINFLTPIIAGVVIGITSMISSILNRLSATLQQATQDTVGEAGTAGQGLMSMISEGIPTFYFQIIVGVYVVQIIIILTIMVNGIENGVDPINEKHLLGVNLIKSVSLYIVMAFTITLVFNIIAATILASV